MHSMRKKINFRRGAFGGPIVTLLITVAAIALAGFVIFMFWGYATPRASLTVDTQYTYLEVVGSDAYLYIRAKAVGSDITIKSISIVTDSGTPQDITLSSSNVEVVSGGTADVTVSGNGVKIMKDKDVTIRVTLSGLANELSASTSYKVTIITDKAGTVPITVPKV